MRGKRRSRGTWFPCLGSEFTIADDTIRDNAFTGNIILSADGEPTTIVHPITFDAPQNENSPTAIDQTLSEIMGSEYILKRVLGNIVINSGNDAGTEGDPPSRVDVCAGFCVARADNDTAELLDGRNSPIGYASAGPLDQYSNYNPLSSDNIREPWMWRRSWPLSGRGYGDATAGPSDDWPHSNREYHQLNLGPTVDIKSRRRVGVDERLWLIVGAAARGVGGTEPIGAEVHYRVDLRIFGQIVRAKNDGNF